jgi:hypothetical protein
LRLLAVACCAPLLEKVRIPEIPLVEMVRTAERFADGVNDASELARVFPQRGTLDLFEIPAFVALPAVGQRTCQAVVKLGWSPDEEEPPWGEEYAADGTMLAPRPWMPGEYAVHCTHRAMTSAAQAWSLFASGSPYPGPRETYGPWHATSGVPMSYYRFEKERHAWFADLLRDVIGNPIRPVLVDPSWSMWNHGIVCAIARRVYDERAFHDLPILADTLEDAGCTDPEVLAHCRCEGPHIRGCWVVDLLLGQD